MTKLIERGRQWKDTGNQKETIDGEPARVTRLEVDDATTYIDKDGSDNMILVDAVTGSKTLAELAAGAAGAVDTSGTPAANDFAQFTDADTIRGRDATETKTDLSLNLVENTAHSTDAHTMTIDGVDVSAHATTKAANATLGHVIVETASKVDVDASGKLTLGSDVLLEGDLENPPIEDSSTTAATSEYIFDHNARDATSSVQGHATAAQITKLDGIGTGADVVGPASSTDNEIARQHSTTGKILQTYTSNPPTISDSGDVNIDGDLDVENIVVSGNVDGKDVSGLATAAESVAAVEAAGLTFAENKGVILDAVLSADEKWSGFVEAGTAGETLDFGDCVYHDVTEGEWMLAQADETASSGAVKLGINVTVAQASNGGAITVLLWGKVRSDTDYAFTVDAPVFIDAGTAGDLTSTAPTGTTNFVVRIVGYGNTADELFFCPDNTYVELA